MANSNLRVVYLYVGYIHINGQDRIVKFSSFNKVFNPDEFYRCEDLQDRQFYIRKGTQIMKPNYYDCKILNPIQSA